MAKRDRGFDRWLASRRGLTEADLRRALEQLDVDTLDRWAFGVVGDQVVRIDPMDLTIVHRDDLENAEYQADRYPGGPARWARSVSLKEPVDVVVNRPGELVLDDGHHRYLAARLMGRKLTGKIQVKGKPIEVLLELAARTAAASSGRKSRALIEAEIAEALARRS